MMIDRENECSKWLSEKYDCLWVVLKKKRTESVFCEELRDLDWKLGGVISRFLVQSKHLKVPTFFPTHKSILTPYLVLEWEPGDWDIFFKNCKGLDFQNVSYFCEDESNFPKNEREWSRYGSHPLPERLSLVTRS